MMLFEFEVGEHCIISVLAFPSTKINSVLDVSELPRINFQKFKTK